MTLTDSICEKINNNVDIDFSNKKNISFILLILLGNGIYVNKKIVESIEQRITSCKGKSDVIKHLHRSLKYKRIFNVPQTINECSFFFTIMFLYKIRCSHKMREEVKSCINLESHRNTFILGSYILNNALENDSFDNTGEFQLIFKKIKKKIQQKIKEKKYQEDRCSYGPRMSDSNSVWSNNISKFVIHIPMGGQNKKY